MKRRQFLQFSGLSLLYLRSKDPTVSGGDDQPKHDIELPIAVSAIINGETVKLSAKNKQTWIFNSVVVQLLYKPDGLVVDVEAPGVFLSEVTLRWSVAEMNQSKLVNDDWERTYGNVAWHIPVSEEILPWYFLANTKAVTTGFGVKTGPNAFCSWRVLPEQLHCILDTRSGGDGVALGKRKLSLATLVTIVANPDESVYQTARRFMKLMCPTSRTPNHSIYGINDWYFSYGNNSEKLIVEHTKMMAPMADRLTNRPYSVVDAGWFAKSPNAGNDCCWGDGMIKVNDRFGNMASLAQKIKQLDMRPGIWTRPLCATHSDAKSILLPQIKGRTATNPVLDPTIPENRDRIKNCFKQYMEWQYELVKFDFTSFDLFGQWGFEMRASGQIAESGWHMSDQSKTNAEIVLTLYQDIREAAGNTCVIGCNTFSHLAAGIFELNRIGDDTSGKDWNRTKTMGVNTLSFRGIQHGIFYAADSDCVGLTTDVPWKKNEQWMRLLAESGTPLFISAQPNAVGVEQKKVIAECFRLASGPLPLCEPLDWLDVPICRKWKLNGKEHVFSWD